MDDVPQDVKNRRVFEMAKVYRAGAEELNAACIGQQQLILIEGVSVCACVCTLNRNRFWFDALYSFLSFSLFSLSFSRRANDRQMSISVGMKPI